MYFEYSLHAVPTHFPFLKTRQSSQRKAGGRKGCGPPTQPPGHSCPGCFSVCTVCLHLLLPLLSPCLFHIGRDTPQTTSLGRTTLQGCPKEQKAKPRSVNLSLRLNISKSAASPLMDQLTHCWPPKVPIVQVSTQVCAH